MESKKKEKKTISKAVTDTVWDVVVIGGGPAGMMAAGRAAERGQKVLLIEKNAGLGKKLLITGGGRCNVTNAELNNRILLAKFKDSDKFLFSAFAQHSVKDTLDFFHNKGMQTKVENDQRVFPVSDSAGSVWLVLVQYMKAHNVKVLSGASVTGFIQSKPAIIDAISLKSGETIKGKTFILATGGKSHPETGSTGDGFGWLTKIGHTVADAQSALVPIEVTDPWVRKLSGFSLPTAKITLYQNDIKQGTKTGKVLFTHFGLSGPAILNMSSEISELLKYGEVILSLDLLPQHDYATLNEALQQLFIKESNKKFKNALPFLIPSSLVPAVLEKSGIDPDVFCHSVSREERLLLIQVLKDMRMKPTKLLGTDRAIITAGGVALSEINWKTMASRLVPNLHIIGDMLNIDRPSGGYSLQLCWTTGWVAGSAVGENSNISKNIK